MALHDECARHGMYFSLTHPCWFPYRSYPQSIIQDTSPPYLANYFTPTASADYAGPFGLLIGLENIVLNLQKAIGHVTTFHALSTQAIHLTGSGDTAEATTYVSASHYLGVSTFLAKARHFDKLARLARLARLGGGVDGRIGEEKWLIESRYVTMVMVGVPKGDVTIFGMEPDGWVETLKG